MYIVTQSQKVLDYCITVGFFLLLAPDAASPPTAVSSPSALYVTWDPPER